jgi:serine/threonine-protein kinase 24/25/MST4
MVMYLEITYNACMQLTYPSLDKTSTLVAVKIVNIDDMDFTADPRERDETVKDFRKEVGILQQLKDSGARNVNLIHEAFDLHSQLWIISDYCTGGSVRTLMRANPTPKLEEHFLIPVARELAVAMKCVHDIGVIHRDIKCTNVYVTEDGQIQLGLWV